MGINLNKYTPKMSFGKSRDFSRGETSTARADASKKGKEKASEEGSNKSRATTTDSSRTEQFLSSESDSGTPIHERFPDFDAYLAHQNAKTAIRGQNAEMVLAEIKKDLVASEARLNQALVQTDKEEAKAVKAHKKEQRKLKKAIAKEKAFVAKAQAKAAKEQKKLESKLNKQGKLSLRQQAQKEIDAKAAYERDLNAALAESALEGASPKSTSTGNTSEIIRDHAKDYFPSHENSPRDGSSMAVTMPEMDGEFVVTPGGTAHFEVPQGSTHGADRPASHSGEGGNTQGSEPRFRSLDNPVQQEILNRLQVRLDNFPGGFNAEFHDPSAVPEPPDRVPGETRREMINRVLARDAWEASTGVRTSDISTGPHPLTPRPGVGPSQSPDFPPLSGSESGHRSPSDSGNPSQGNPEGEAHPDIPESSGARANAPRVNEDVEIENGVPVPRPRVTAEDVQNNTSPRSDTTPESPLTPSTIPSSADSQAPEVRIEQEVTVPSSSVRPEEVQNGTSPRSDSSSPTSKISYTSSEYRKDMHKIARDKAAITNKKAVMEGREEDMVSPPETPQRRPGPSGRSPVPRKIVEEMKARVQEMVNEYNDHLKAKMDVEAASKNLNMPQFFQKMEEKRIAQNQERMQRMGLDIEWIDLDGADPQSVRGSGKNADALRERLRAGKGLPASNQSQPGETSSAARRPSLSVIPPNIVQDRVDAIEESLRSPQTGVDAFDPMVPRSLRRSMDAISPDSLKGPFGKWNEGAPVDPPTGKVPRALRRSEGAISPNSINGPFGTWNNAPVRHHDSTMAWAWDALPAALAANASVPPTQLPKSPAASVHSSSSSEKSESPRAATPKAEETPLSERIAWAQDALRANPRLGSRSSMESISIPEEKRDSVSSLPIPERNRLSVDSLPPRPGRNRLSVDSLPPLPRGRNRPSMDSIPSIPRRDRDLMSTLPIPEETPDATSSAPVEGRHRRKLSDFLAQPFTPPSSPEKK